MLCLLGQPEIVWYRVVKKLYSKLLCAVIDFGNARGAFSATELPQVS